MPHFTADPLRIDPDHQRPSILSMMAGGIPKRNEDFRTYAAQYNKCVDQDERAFYKSTSDALAKTGEQGGHYTDPSKPPPSPIKLGTEIQANERDVQPSKVTDIDTISVKGRVVGFVYGTADGHMAIQAATPEGTLSTTKGHGWASSLGLTKGPVSASVSYSSSVSATTSGPNRGDVVPLTRLDQLPKNSVIQPLEDSNSRQLLAKVPHANAEQFQKDHERPDAFTYKFSRLLPHVHGHLFSISNILHVHRGEHVTIVNGPKGLETHHQEYQQQQNLGRV